ncbi:hypothetical protein [Streptomyces sp. ISID311]|uniref:hypothetical protein n=1 Tax=Streptomyces sp. ISID311 TaxID=2601673 RepID=UPI00164AC9C4|nr:hypothetical protein [Streptomyces sp. ISID311]
MRSGAVHRLPSPVGGPLGGRELSTDPGPWAGDWLTARDADGRLYVPVHREPATGVVLAEARPTVPRRW